MPWVMAAMTAAQMMQGQQNREKQMKMDEARIRYSPWSKLGPSEMQSVPNNSVDTAQQGYTGITGQMQAEKKSGLQDKLTQAQIDRLNMLNGKGGAPMNQGQGPVRGYENPAGYQNQGWMDLMNQQPSGANQYMKQSPWSMGGRF